MLSGRHLEPGQEPHPVCAQVTITCSHFSVNLYESFERKTARFWTFTERKVLYQLDIPASTSPRAPASPRVMV